jgi:cholinesterase
VDCMRSKKAEDIMKGVTQLAMKGTMVAFGPIPDGKVVHADPKARWAAGEVIKRVSAPISVSVQRPLNTYLTAKQPILTGSNDKELGLIKGLLDPLASPSPSSAAANPMAGFTSYLAKTVGDLMMSDRIGGVGSDIVFNCPVAEAAALRAKNGVKSWRYRFMGEYNNTALVPQMGAYHSADVPLVFGSAERKRGAKKDDPEQAKLVKLMMHAWAEFARDPDNGLVKLGWPVYKLSGKCDIKTRYEVFMS